jgi:hypothetical protein
MQHSNLTNKQIRAKQEESRRLQQERMNTIKRHKDKIQEENKKGAEKRKKERKMHEEQITKSHNKMLLQKQENYSISKLQEEIRKEGKRVKDSHKVSNNKEHYNHRVLSEHDRMKQKEKELIEMEQMESELIKKLQTTQQVQKETFGELENALNYESPYRVSSPRKFKKSKNDLSPHRSHSPHSPMQKSPKETILQSPPIQEDNEHENQ